MPIPELQLELHFISNSERDMFNAKSFIIIIKIIFNFSR